MSDLFGDAGGPVADGEDTCVAIGIGLRTPELAKAASGMRAVGVSSSSTVPGVFKLAKVAERSSEVYA